jgi:hypothetical protein
MLTIGSTIKETALEAVEVNGSNGGIHSCPVSVKPDAAAALDTCLSPESGPFGASCVLEGRSR